MAYMGLSPLTLPEYISIRSNTRSSTNTGVMFGLNASVMPSNRKSVFYHSFFPSCISRWNSLPADVRNSTSLADFTTKLNSHIWNAVALRRSLLDIDPEPD